jgi:hypothetical protein
MDKPIKSIMHHLVPVLLVILPGFLIIGIQYGWKTAYLWKGSTGIYWLFLFLDRQFVPCILITAIFGLFFLVLRWFSKSTKNKYRFLLASLSSFIISISVLFTLPVVFANCTYHIQSIRAEGKIYHLGAYPLFDINFYVVECDPLGILCRKIYRSGDIIDSSWDRSSLYFNDKTRILELHEPEKGIIFSYKVPKR